MTPALAEELLGDVLTTTEPLGPHSTEKLLDEAGTDEAFLALYDPDGPTSWRLGSSSSMCHYIVGRKGSGKTALLIGQGLRAGHQVFSIRSEALLDLVDDLRRSWENRRGNLSADNLADLWEVMLTHAAMRGMYLNAEPSDAAVSASVRGYVSGIAEDADEGGFLSAVAQHLGNLIDASGPSLIRDVLHRATFRGITYTQARAEFTEALADPRRRPMCLVVDNLEDLHMRLDKLRFAVAGLFRLVTRMSESRSRIVLPYDIRFAFPAELRRNLRDIAANPEKDFRNPVVISWTAAALIELAGSRLAYAIELHQGREVRGLDPETVLRSVLPVEPIRNGFGREEDAVAYLMRHTQLLPRHVIQLLNGVLAPAFAAGRPRATPAEVRSGVREAEQQIVEGILSSYSYDLGRVGECLKLLKNRVLHVGSMSELHRSFNHAGIRVRLGVEFDWFVESAVNVGVFGVHVRSTGRYEVADFSYTQTGTLRPVEGEHQLCVHPLFVHELFDPHQIRQLAVDGAWPVYPYGTGMLTPGGVDDAW